MPNLIDKDAAYTALKHEADTHECYESKEAYNRSARIIDQMPTVPDINRAEIMRLCNEIEEIATLIGNYGDLYKTVVAARHICDRVKSIGKELTVNAEPPESEVQDDADNT